MFHSLLAHRPSTELKKISTYCQVGKVIYILQWSDTINKPSRCKRPYTRRRIMLMSLML